RRLVTLAYIGLGANLGDAQATLEQAAGQLGQTPDISDVALSRFYRSAPVDASGPDYINAVASLETTLTARQLLDRLQEIESEHGRLRPYRHAPRTLDLDLLLYGTHTIEEPDLV